MDRHLLGYTERHRRVAGRSFDLRLFLSVRAPFCDRVFCEYCAGRRKILEPRMARKHRGLPVPSGMTMAKKLLQIFAHVHNADVTKNPYLGKDKGRPQ